MKRYLSILILIIFTGCTTEESNSIETSLLVSPTNTLLQAISIVDENTAWLSGHNASFVRTQDGGESWELFKHPTGDSLQFRDIHAFDNETVVLMSAGPGPLSRLFTFTTPDQWKENFVMPDSLGFLDCIDFWDDKRGIAYGDAIDSYPYILLTSNGGQSWSRADSTSMPKAGKGEGGFAASGTCVTTGKNGVAWIASGVSGNSRILITQDYGASWKVVESPIISGEAAGNTSISFVDQTGFVTGGDLMVSDKYTENCAFTADGGNTWTLSNKPQTKGAFYGGAITNTEDQIFAFACGPNGLDYTSDQGQTWKTLDSLNYWAVSFKGNTGYASGTDGKILKISLQP